MHPRAASGSPARPSTGSPPPGQACWPLMIGYGLFIHRRLRATGKIAPTQPSPRVWDRFDSQRPPEPPR